jgi:hypothetical protein
MGPAAAQLLRRVGSHGNKRGLRLRIIFQKCVATEGQDLVIQDGPDQTKADCILAVFTAGKARIYQQSGLVHQAMRIMVYTINATDRNRITGNKFHLQLLR